MLSEKIKFFWLHTLVFSCLCFVAVFFCYFINCLVSFIIGELLCINFTAVLSILERPGEALAHLNTFLFLSELVYASFEKYLWRIKIPLNP